ncbi:Tetratricopeptide repeat protein [Aphelenchoides besseyi]|nr:Tetratricopeptide repeat protein [Aphelenchoides besseyi]
MKTSIWKLKTKPEYDLAAYEFDRAAVCYKNAQDWKSCVENYLQAAECYRNTGNKYHEGKSKEQAALVAKDSGDLDQATKLFEECAELYLESNSQDSAAMVLDKAGKLLEAVDTNKAIEFYTKGMVLVQEADRSKLAISFMNRLITNYLKLNDYSNAVKTSVELIERYKENKDFNKIGQIGLGIVIIELVRNDSIAARKALPYLLDTDGHSFTSEMNAAQCLIRTYEAGEEEELQQVLKSGIIRTLDNSLLRILKHLHAPAAHGDDGDEEDLR